jgi:Zn ribbon nucleic-acid-binding protein
MGSLRFLLEIEMKKRIICAALCCNDSDLAISKGSKVDHDELVQCLAHLMRMTFDVMDKKVERGFLTSRGKWVCRRTALKIARKADQKIVWQEGDDRTMLHSHNLWPELYHAWTKE